MRPITPEKREIILKLKEAVGGSAIRLQIIKNVTKKESIADLQERLKISQPTVSKAITRFETYGLIQLVKKKGKSEVYNKTPMLRQIGNIDKWIKVKLGETDDSLTPSKIKVKPRVPATIPYLEPKVEIESQKMARHYVILYLFENSVRAFINKILTDKYDQDWWNKISVRREIADRVIGRKKLEGKNKWHVPRGAHEIYYTDLEDLTYFLRKENAFKDYLDIDLWDTTINKVVKLSRNIVDHHNPLPQREVNRLEQILEDWKRQLK